MNIDINGADTYVFCPKPEPAVVEGLLAERRALLFLHGSGGDHTIWASIAEKFSRLGFRVAVPDLPAHSRSKGSPLASIESSAEWLLALVEALDLKHVDLIGHSQGFLTAVEFAAAYPQRVSSLIGVASADKIPVNAALLEMAQHSRQDAALLMNKWSFYVDEHDQDQQQRVTALRAKNSTLMASNPLHQDLVCCANYRLSDRRVASIKKPCFMLLSKNDKMTPVENGLAAARRLSAKVEFIEGAGHMLPSEAAEQVFDRLNTFLTSVPSSLKT